MKSNRLQVAAAWVVCLCMIGFGVTAMAGKKTPPAKTELATLKLANLTQATKAPAVKKLTDALKKVKGVAKVTVDKKKGEVAVRYAPGSDLAAIKAAVAAGGFSVVEPKAAEPAPAADEGDDEEE